VAYLGQRTGCHVFTEALSALDLLVLTATVDNRKEIMKLKQTLDLFSMNYMHHEYAGALLMEYPW